MSDNIDEINKNISRENLYNQYFKENKSIDELSRMYNVSKSNISNMIKEYCKVNQIQNNYSKYTPLDFDLNIDMDVAAKQVIDNEKTINELAKEYNVSEHYMKVKVRNYIKDKKLNRFYPNSKKILPVDEIIEQLKNGEKLSEISKKYNVSTNTISKRLREKCTEKELEMLYNKKYYELLNKSNEILNMYLEGISVKDISKKYNTTVYTIKNILNELYNSKGQEVPVIANAKVVENLVKVKHLSENELLEYAKNSNRFIPKKYYEHLFQEEKPIELDKIKHFVIDKCVSHKENLNFNITNILKNKEYSNEFIATSLLYELQKNIDTTEDEIKEISNDKVLYALQLLNSFDGNKALYTKNIKKSELSKVVKLAEYYEKINNKENDSERMNINDYKSISKLAENTKFSDDFNEYIVKPDER